MGLEYVHQRRLNADMAKARIRKEQAAQRRLQEQREQEAQAALRAVISERARVAREAEESRRAQARAAVESELRARFLAAGGTEAEWTRQRTAIVDAYLATCALTGGGSLRDDVGELRRQSAYNRLG